MKISKELMEKAGVLPKLHLGIKQAKGGVKTTGPHRVTLVSDKIVRDMDRETGKEAEFVIYSVEEKGIQKEYRTRLKDKKTGKLSYLVQRLSEFEEGSEVILEMKKAGIINYVEVTPVGDTTHYEIEEDIDVDDEPTIDIGEDPLK